MAIVSQETHVFAGPLVDDLRLARPDATDDEIDGGAGHGRARWTGRRRCPTGCDTLVGEGGHALTAAQAQQLALARLVLADPAVAVLDEATAEAGSAGARELEAAAAAATAGPDHADRRAPADPGAPTADRIVVMDDGRHRRAGHARRAAGRSAAGTRDCGGAWERRTTACPANEVRLT